MRPSALSATQQVVLLFALALGLVGMHELVVLGDNPHTAGPASMSVMSNAAAPAPQMVASADLSPLGQHSPASHDVMHLCLAVLCAIVATLLGLWLLLRTPVSNPPGGALARAPSTGPPDRPPDRRGRVLLTSLCVLRV
jgi:hypothetical protein